MKYNFFYIKLPWGAEHLEQTEQNIVNIVQPREYMFVSIHFVLQMLTDGRVFNEAAKWEKQNI